MINKKIYLQRRNKVCVPSKSENPVSDKYIFTAIKNLEAYGYTFSLSVINDLMNTSKEDFIAWYKELEADIVSLVGKRGTMIPMFPNFPKEVMEATDLELYRISILHYLADCLSCEEIRPTHKIEEKFPLIDNTDLTVINSGSVEDFNSIFTNLLSSKTSLSENDKDTVKWFVENIDINEIMPKEVPNKETLSYLTMLLWDNKDLIDLIIPLYKTATDVLRLAVALNEEDVSLSQYPMFKSFKRAERRLLLSMLENSTNIEEDMLRHKILWIRLGEKLHPGEYKKFKKVNTAFKKIRNGEKISTFLSKLELAFKNNNTDNIISLLSKRPGEFARSLDRVLRNADDTNKVLKAFEGVSNNISTPVLLQLKEHFSRRNDYLERRTFFPKGSMQKVYSIENNLTKLDEEVCLKVVEICEKTLIDIYSKKETLGKVYIDESLKNFIVPMAQRSASKALKSVARGSRFTIDKETTAIRGFVYWKEPAHEVVDIDLSAVFYDDDMVAKDEICYWNLRNDKLKTHHSGDIRSAPNGASEYIDVDIETLKENGIRYVALVVNSYSDIPFDELPECFVGFMEREDVNSGEIYEPKTLINKSDIATSSTQSMPMIIDIEAMEVIWTDLIVTNNNSINNVATNRDKLTLTVKSMINMVKPNMYDLAMLHTKARGEVVLEKEKADTVFSLTEGITPYDVDIIMGDYI